MHVCNGYTYSLCCCFGSELKLIHLYIQVRSEETNQPNRQIMSFFPIKTKQPGFLEITVASKYTDDDGMEICEPNSDVRCYVGAIILFKYASDQAPHKNREMYTCT